MPAQHSNRTKQSVNHLFFLVETESYITLCFHILLDQILTAKCFSNSLILCKDEIFEITCIIPLISFLASYNKLDTQNEGKNNLPILKQTLFIVFKNNFTLILALSWYLSPEAFENLMLNMTFDASALSIIL